MNLLLKHTRLLMLATLLGFGSMMLVACDDGPLENAGEEIDDAVDDAADEVDDAL